MNKFNTSKRINMIFFDLFLSHCGLLAQLMLWCLFSFATDVRLFGLREIYYGIMKPWPFC
jgi:hypothetical protein